MRIEACGALLTKIATTTMNGNKTKQKNVTTGNQWTKTQFQQRPFCEEPQIAHSDSITQIPLQSWWWTLLRLQAQRNLYFHRRLITQWFPLAKINLPIFSSVCPSSADMSKLSIVCPFLRCFLFSFLFYRLVVSIIFNTNFCCIFQQLL